MTVQNQQITDTVVPKSNGSVLSPNAVSDPCSAPLLDVERAAEYLSMSQKWLYRDYSRLPHILIGDGKKPRIRFRRCDLDGWVKRHRIQ
jgi:hypothetical protein